MVARRKTRAIGTKGKTIVPQGGDQDQHVPANGELLSTEQVVDLAKTQEAWHRQQLDLYQGIVDRFGDRPELSRRVATARSGVAYARALADFWADIAAHPPEVTPSD